MTTAGGDGLEPLRRRDAPEELLAQLAGSGLPGAAACRAVATSSMIGRLRARLLPRSRLTKAEGARLEAIAVLAADVRDMKGSAERAGQFWCFAMPGSAARHPPRHSRAVMDRP